MKLATLKSKDKKNRNGELVVVSRDNQWAVKPDASVASTLLGALESWDETSPKLANLADKLNEKGSGTPGAFALDMSQCLADRKSVV